MSYVKIVFGFRASLWYLISCRNFMVICAVVSEIFEVGGGLPPMPVSCQKEQKPLTAKRYGYSKFGCCITPRNNTKMGLNNLLKICLLFRKSENLRVMHRNLMPVNIFIYRKSSSSNHWCFSISWD